MAVVPAHNGWHASQRERQGERLQRAPVGDTEPPRQHAHGVRAFYDRERRREARQGGDDPATQPVGFKNGIDRAVQDAAAGDDDVNRIRELPDSQRRGRQRVTGTHRESHLVGADHMRGDRCRPVGKTAHVEVDFAPGQVLVVVRALAEQAQRDTGSGPRDHVEEPGGERGQEDVVRADGEGPFQSGEFQLAGWLQDRRRTLHELMNFVPKGERMSRGHHLAAIADQ